jgi:hypothetical protein
MVPMEKLHIIRWPCRISSVCYSPDAKYLAVGGGASLIVFEAKEDAHCFIPICRDEVNKDTVLTLQWITADEILVLRQAPEASLYHERVRFSKLKSAGGLSRTSYNYCEHWKLSCCKTMPEIEESRQLFTVSGSGAEGCYYSPIGNRSLAIYKLPFHIPVHMNQLSCS